MWNKTSPTLTPVDIGTTAPSVHGVVYPEGNISLGCACVSPLLEIHNDTEDSLQITYSSDSASAVSVTLLSGGLHLAPGISACSGSLQVSNARGEETTFALRHLPEKGYFLSKMTGSHLKLELVRQPFLLRCAGSPPAWAREVVVAVRFTV